MNFLRKIDVNRVVARWVYCKFVKAYILGGPVWRNQYPLSTKFGAVNSNWLLLTMFYVKTRVRSELQWQNTKNMVKYAFSHSYDVIAMTSYPKLNFFIFPYINLEPYKQYWCLKMPTTLDVIFSNRAPQVPKMGRTEGWFSQNCPMSGTSTQNFFVV